MFKTLTFNRVLFTLVAALSIGFLKASDHDDGQLDNKGQALNLTELYAFREDWQTGSAGDKGNLILIMSTNPRSLPGQPYFFSTNARYEFHITRVATANAAVAPTGLEDVVLRFTFDAPTNPADSTDDSLGAKHNQVIHFTAIKDGVATVADSASAVTTDSLLDSISPGGLAANAFTTGAGLTLTTFGVAAGMRQDTFFFDVNGFFKTRFNLYKKGVLGVGGAIDTTDIAFNSVSSGYSAAAQDFTAFYNVNSIAVRVPLDYLQTTAGAGNKQLYDIWETISVAQ